MTILSVPITTLTFASIFQTNGVNEMLKLVSIIGWLIGTLAVYFMLSADTWLGSLIWLPFVPVGFVFPVWVAEQRRQELEKQILEILHLHPNSAGIPIAKQVKARTGKRCSTGSLYTTLSRLGDEGLVSSDYRLTNRGMRFYYSLTPEGERALKEQTN